MIPEGTYVAVARAREWGDSKKGTDQLHIKFEIIEGEHAGESVRWQGTFNDGKAEEIACEALRNCGWKGDDVVDGLGPLDQKVRIVVQHNEWHGKTYPKVQWVRALGGGHITLKAPLTDARKRRLQARVRAKAQQFKEVAGESANAPAPTKAPSPAPLSDPKAAGTEFEEDDIPF